MHDRSYIDEKAQELLLNIDSFHRIRITSFFSKFKASQSSSIMPRSTVQISILISTDLFNWISWGNEREWSYTSHFFQRVKCALFRFRVKVKVLRSREDRDLRLAGECIYVGEKWKDSRWCNVGSRLACWVANDGLVFSDLERKLRKDNECRKKFKTTLERARAWLKVTYARVEMSHWGQRVLFDEGGNVFQSIKTADFTCP